MLRHNLIFARSKKEAYFATFVFFCVRFSILTADNLAFCIRLSVVLLLPAAVVVLRVVEVVVAAILDERLKCSQRQKKIEGSDA